MSSPVNREGLTFAEWFAAANFGRRVPHPEGPAIWKAFAEGEDPTEWAAATSPWDNKEIIHRAQQLQKDIRNV